MKIQAMPTEVTWGRDGHQAVSTVEELDALLDRIDGTARQSGRPEDVQITVAGDAGTLGVVVGHDRSVLNHVPADRNPPYMSSLGDQEEDRPFTFFVAGDHHSEAAWRHTIPRAQARNAARVFFATGQLDGRVRWEEV